MMFYNNVYYPFTIDEWIHTDVGQYKVMKNLQGHRPKGNRPEGCNWLESKDICTEEGGYLTQIATDKENWRILEILTEMEMVEAGFNFYIGMQKINGKHVWSSDQRKVGYANFKQGEYCSENSEWNM